MKIADRKKASILILLLLSTFLSFAPIPALYGDSENWLEGWSYRKSHIIEQASGAGTNYQVKITVHYDNGTDSGEHVYLDSKCQSDFDDIRFTDDTGWTLLDYWMESKDPETSAVFWVEVQDDLSSSDATIYIYYGNDEATTTSNGTATFPEFEDFTGTTHSMTVYNQNTSRIEITHDTVNDRLQCEWKTVGLGNYKVSHAYWSAVSSGHAMRMNYYRETPSDLVANKIYQMCFGENYTTHYPPNSNDSMAGHCVWTAADTWPPSRAYECSVNDGNKQNSSIYSISLDMWNVYEVTWASNNVSTYWNNTHYWSTSNTTCVPDENLYPIVGGARGSMSTSSGSFAYWDWILVRKFVENEPQHGDWEEEGNLAPTNSGFAFLDMDDTDNLYAQKQYYTAQYVVTDYDGYADIDYAEFSIMQSSNIRATFRFDEDTATFSIEAGSPTWDLDVGSCSNVSSGKTITMNFTISPKFNAIEESDIDISAFVVDDETENSTDTIQTDYADVVTDLVVSGFACDDNRGNIGQTLNFSGTVYYANNPSSGTASSSYPPDSKFTAVHVYDSKAVSQGSDNSIIDGAFSVSFSALSTVDLETYNPYIDIADAEYTDAEESPTATFISDRIRILTLGADDTRVNVDGSAEIYATAELEYDGHGLGSGDSLSVESLDLIWNATHFVGAESKPSVQQKVYDSGEGEETTFGVTALNLDSRSVSVVWDRLNVTFTVDADLVPLNTETEFKVTIFREYDNSSVSSYSYNINRDGLGFGNPHTTEAFTDVSSSEGTRIYDFTNVTDNTYGLTAFTDPHDLFVAWYDAGIQLNQIVLILGVALIVTAIAAGLGLLIYFRKRK